MTRLDARVFKYDAVATTTCHYLKTDGRSSLCSLVGLNTSRFFVLLSRRFLILVRRRRLQVFVGFFFLKRTLTSLRYCYYVFVNLLNKARTRTAVGIHQRERVGAGRPLSPAGNWRMLINWSKWRTIFRNRFGSNLEQFSIRQHPYIYN